MGTEVDGGVNMHAVFSLHASHGVHFDLEPFDLQHQYARQSHNVVLQYGVCTRALGTLIRHFGILRAPININYDCRRTAKNRLRSDCSSNSSSLHERYGIINKKDVHDLVFGEKEGKVAVCVSLECDVAAVATPHGMLDFA